MDELDYDALLERLLPLLAGRLDKDSSLGKLASGGGGMARALFKKLPQEKKDRTAAELINKNRDKLRQKAEEYAGKYGVRIEVKDVSAHT